MTKKAGVVGVVGLGAMGAGMAASLRRAGFELCVFDVRSAAVAAFVRDGGRACASAAELARESDVVVSVVVNAAQTEELLFGRGAAQSRRPSARWRSCAGITGSPFTPISAARATRGPMPRT